MNKKYLSFFVVPILTLLLMVGFFLIGPNGLYTPIHQNMNSTIIVEKGMGARQIANRLKEAGLISNAYVFLGAIYVSGKGGRLKPGEYLIPEGTCPIDIIDIIESGKGIVHQLTIPEGYTVSEIADRVEKISILKGEITHLPQEGYLLPETYKYEYGETKQDLIDRMEKSMKVLLLKAWSDRQADLPYASPHEALVMASIVEKETGFHSERARVAAVFVNRLRVGMKLQADPTVIYGITLGRRKLGRCLSKADLQMDSPYNTYMIPGLPPHPIACPGKAAIHAALNPLETKDLYFVANGEGSHYFSDNLSQHNTNVQGWRKKIQCR